MLVYYDFIPDLLPKFVKVTHKTRKSDVLVIELKEMNLYFTKLIYDQIISAYILVH